MKTLYFGDNLEITREYIPDNSVDLIYLDPPFNSNRAYNIIFKDKEDKYPPSQIKAFDDTWSWSTETELVLDELQKPVYPSQLVHTLSAFQMFLRQSDLMAYLVMMSIRLCEMRSVLKDTGSIYLHCDPTASHYLKIILDQVFGAKNFQNEIVWCYEIGARGRKRWARKHDVILFYTKTENFHFDWKSVAQKRKLGTHMKVRKDKKGREYQEKIDAKTGKSYKYYIDEGTIPPDWWIGIQQLNREEKERLGYPTQKPQALLERIILASSNEGDVVLDPFCGCGTTVAAAEKLNRKWIGIDITVLAINLIENRMKENFPSAKFEIKGIPKDYDSAKKMAETRKGKFIFEHWFITALGGQPYKSSGGADAGIDGFMYFKDIENKLHRVIIQVKGGHYNRENVAALARVVEREKATLGLMLVLEEPTKQSLTEAASAGIFTMPNATKKYPKIQIYSVTDYFAGKKPELPDTSGTLKKAEIIKKNNDKNLPGIE